jgi:hypothetical protein
VDEARWHPNWLHAYGWATDTPAHLDALTDGDEPARKAAVAHLNSAIIHQGTPWTATGPAALRVAEVLGDPRLSGVDLAPLRAELLEFLAEVGEACMAPLDDDSLAAMRAVDRPDFDAELAAWFAREVERIRADFEQDGADPDQDDLMENAYEALFADNRRFEEMMARAFLGCVRAAPVLLAAAGASLDDPDPRVRAAASSATAALGAAREARRDLLDPR